MKERKANTANYVSKSYPSQKSQGFCTFNSTQYTVTHFHNFNKSYFVL